MVAKVPFALFVLALITESVFAQSTSGPKYMDQAIVEPNGSMATVVANDPVPLFQAISALRQQYGWQINWEAAPGYSPFDVVDDTSPRWRAAHPGVKGVTRPAGGSFVSTFRVGDDARAASAEHEIMAKVISDYNATENPGRYALRKGTDGRVIVVGMQVRDEVGSMQEIVPILDTRVTVPRQRRSAFETVSEILKAVSDATGKRIIIMSVPNNLFRDTQVVGGGQNVMARQLILDALDSTKRPLQYDLGYDPDNSPVYILNVSVATKAVVDQFGNRKLVPLDRLR